MTGIIHPHYLLDTVAAIARLNGDPAFLAALDVQAVVSIPIIVLGELYAGAVYSLMWKPISEALISSQVGPKSCYAIGQQHGSTQESRINCAKKAGLSPRTISGLRRWQCNITKQS
jgi:hypothetical protein